MFSVVRAQPASEVSGDGSTVGSAPGGDFRRHYLSDASLRALSEGFCSLFERWARGESCFQWSPGVGRAERLIEIADCSDEERRAVTFSVCCPTSGREQQRFLVSTADFTLIGSIDYSQPALFPRWRTKPDQLSWDDLTRFIQSHSAPY